LIFILTSFFKVSIEYFISIVHDVLIQNTIKVHEVLIFLSSRCIDICQLFTID